MRCIGCSSNNWKNVDEHRIKKEGMSVCLECGFVSYPKKYKSYAEIKEHYREAYRQPPNASNFYTGQRKCHFHQAFLSSLFTEWKEKGKTNPSVFEIGAAYGMALDWFRRAYPGAEVGGTELTTSFKRNAYHEYKLNLVDEIDLTKKYDLIMSYKVAEHQMDADERLREYAECLTDDGYLYISVPTWFDSMCNFGLPGFDLEYYYSPDHINSWTRDIFENILLRAGFEIVKKDYLIYDSTYLCKRNDANRSLPVFKEAAGSIENKMALIKKANQLLQENLVDEAIAVWPDYPQAWQHKVEKDRKMMFEKGWDFIEVEFIEKMLAACTNTGAVMVVATDLAMRAKQWEKAIGYAEQGLRNCPENPTSYQQLQNILREMALKASSPKEKAHFFEQARNVARHGRSVSAQHFKEFVDTTYLFNSMLPTPHESL